MVADGLLALLARKIAPDKLFALQDAVSGVSINGVWEGVLAS
jgi:hypothetical protein